MGWGSFDVSTTTTTEKGGREEGSWGGVVERKGSKVPKRHSLTHSLTALPCLDQRACASTPCFKC